MSNYTAGALRYTPVMTLRTLTLFVIFAALVFGQLDSNSITVSSSRNTNLQPDQVVFSVYVDTTPDVGLDGVLDALQPAGVTTANFASVATAYVPTGSLAPRFPLEWSFALPVPFAKMKETTAMLSNLQQTVIQTNSSLIILFSVQGTQIAPQTQQSQSCVLTDVLSDAKAQAQKLADAAGLALGGILALSGSTSTTVSSSVLAPGTYIGRSFSSLTSNAFYLPPCSVSVKFAVK
jgi:hypothetical protein